VLENLVTGGASTVIGVVYSEKGRHRAGAAGYATRLARSAAAVGCHCADVLLVAEKRWWSLTCERTDCCPPDGRPLETASPFAALATVEGRVPLADRQALDSLLEPLPRQHREALTVAIANEERAAVQEVLRGDGPRRERSVKRALFRLARRYGEPDGPAPTDAEVVRYGTALAELPLRDSVWLAVDDGRLDGRPLWRELARRLPAPYDSAPLLLFGWASWRAGEGTLAGMAAERALTGDPDYTAAELLMAAVTSGVNPHSVPRLRRPA
jgi:hypothetical protein